MAKKRHANQSLTWKKQQQKAHRPGARLQEAKAAFARGDLNRALSTAQDALRTANDPTTKQTTQTLLAELHFRLAAASPTPQSRLQHLEQALAAAPDQPRLHYQRALTRWRMGNVEQAVAELEHVARQEPGRPGLPFLRQLGRVATGEEWHTAALSPAEINTLRLLQQLRAGNPVTPAQAENGAQPLLGNTPTLWPFLLQMAANGKSAPVEGLQAVAQQTNALAANPVFSYYAGVAAKRKGELALARTAWEAAARYLHSPWLNENLLHLRRELATELAGVGQWAGVADLYEATSREVGADAVDAVLGETAGVAYAHLGHAAAEAKNWAAAQKQWEKANALIKSRQLSQNLALAYEANGDWRDAALAWREMIRRRPRKEDHPDYLSDDQVAAIWRHAAHCYQEEEISEEAITCVRNALKYTPDDPELRLQLVDLLHDEGRIEATENELERLLEVNPDHVPALTRLGILYNGRWDRDAKPIWRRVLAAEPANAEAKHALAMTYITEARGDPMMGLMGLGSSKQASKQSIKALEAGLKELPDHPLLLVELGNQHMEQKKNDQARSYYERAGRVATKDVAVMNIVLHDLLHTGGGDVVKELTTEMRSISGLQPSFWINQGEKVLECELGESWAEFFWDEALGSSAARREDSPATLFLKMFDVALSNEAPTLAQKYEQRLRLEYAGSGAVEYMDAAYLHRSGPDKGSKALRLLRKAKTVAHKAGEPGIVELAETFEDEIRNPAPSPDLFGGLFNIFREMSGEDRDAFKRFF